MEHKQTRIWTNELIAEGILDVVNTLELEYMPTRVEIRDFYGNDALTNRISKTYGYYGWARRLGLPIKNNDTLKGKSGEKYAAELLQARGYEILQMAHNYPFDLLLNQVVKIDVKYSNLYHGNQGNYYSFALRKKYPTCDIYMLIANNDSGTKLAYFVPAKAVIQTQICLGQHSLKYQKYRNNYELIDKYISLYRNIP